MGYTLSEKIVIMGYIAPWEINTVRRKTREGEHITFFQDGTAELGKGIVLKKYKHHALCKVGLLNKSVMWVDVIRGGKQ